MLTKNLQTDIGEYISKAKEYTAALNSTIGRNAKRDSVPGDLLLSSDDHGDCLNIVLVLVIWKIDRPTISVAVSTTICGFI